MSTSSGLRIHTPDLGGRRGRLSDWITQRWVQLTGRRAGWNEHPWLEAPVGDVDVIGTDFYERFARRNGLLAISDGPPRGLLECFSDLEGPTCKTVNVHPAIRDFYENTSAYEFDVWSEWSPFFRPFGAALAAFFSRRLQQLNIPLGPLDTSRGMTSNVITFRSPDGNRLYSAWVREMIGGGGTMYAGSYSWCRVPGFDGPCVKVAFPLPNGYALVVLKPGSNPDGSLTLRSQGKRFGDPGFYFFVESEPGGGWGRYVATFKEHIHVFVDERSALRTEHELRIWGRTFLRLHYRMRRDSDS